MLHIHRRLRSPREMNSCFITDSDQSTRLSTRALVRTAIWMSLFVCWLWAWSANSCQSLFSFYNPRPLWLIIVISSASSREFKRAILNQFRGNWMFPVILICAQLLTYYSWDLPPWIRNYTRPYLKKHLLFSGYFGLGNGQHETGQQRSTGKIDGVAKGERSGETVRSTVRNGT